MVPVVVPFIKTLAKASGSSLTSLSINLPAMLPFSWAHVKMLKMNANNVRTILKVWVLKFAAKNVRGCKSRVTYMLNIYFDRVTLRLSH